MVAALDGVERKDEGKEGRKAEESLVGRGWHSPGGRTDGLAEAGDEVEQEGRAKKETTRRRRSERSERERGLDLDVIPLGRSVLVPSPASVRWPRCEVLPGQKGRFVMKIRTPKIHKV